MPRAAQEMCIRAVAATCERAPGVLDALPPACAPRVLGLLGTSVPLELAVPVRSPPQGRSPWFACKQGDLRGCLRARHQRRHCPAAAVLRELLAAARARTLEPGGAGARSRRLRLPTGCWPAQTGAAGRTPCAGGGRLLEAHVPGALPRGGAGSVRSPALRAPACLPARRAGCLRTKHGLLAPGQPAVHVRRAGCCALLRALHQTVSASPSLPEQAVTVVRLRPVARNRLMHAAPASSPLGSPQRSAASRGARPRSFDGEPASEERLLALLRLAGEHVRALALRHLPAHLDLGALLQHLPRWPPATRRRPARPPGHAARLQPRALGACWPALRPRSLPGLDRLAARSLGSARVTGRRSGGSTCSVPAPRRAGRQHGLPPAGQGRPGNQPGCAARQAARGEAAGRRGRAGWPRWRWRTGSARCAWATTARCSACAWPRAARCRRRARASGAARRAARCPGAQRRARAEGAGGVVCPENCEACAGEGDAHRQKAAPLELSSGCWDRAACLLSSRACLEPTTGLLCIRTSGVASSPLQRCTGTLCSARLAAEAPGLWAVAGERRGRSAGAGDRAVPGAPGPQRQPAGGRQGAPAGQRAGARARHPPLPRAQPGAPHRGGALHAVPPRSATCVKLPSRLA